MELSVRVDSSLVFGLVTGVALGVATCCHVTGTPIGSVVKLPFSKLKKLSNPTPFQTPSSGEEEKGGEAEHAADRDCFWFTEGLTDVYRVQMVLKRILFDDRSLFQRVQVIDTEQFGTTLVLDGQTQSAKSDEHMYHESLVHPAMLLHPSPKTVFIGGGGEFATAREVLRHSTVQRCVMVDIDELACDMCREHLPEWNAGAYEDPRFHVEYLDAKLWLEENDEKFDVIIMDICDPIEAGPGYKLYTQEFYQFLDTKLNPGGIFVTQSGPCASYNAKDECFTVIHNTLSASFDVVLPYSNDIPSFGCLWGFNLAFASADPSGTLLSLLNTDINKFNQAIEDRILGGSTKLKFLDGIAWRGLMGISKEIRTQCDEEDRVMTIDNPVFMYSS